MWRRARPERRPSWTAAPAARRPPADPPAWAESHSGGLLHAAPRCRHSPQQTRPPSHWLSWEGGRTQRSAETTNWLTDWLTHWKQSNKTSRCSAWCWLTSVWAVNPLWTWRQTSVSKTDWCGYNWELQQISLDWLTASSTSGLTDCFGLSSVCSVLQTLTTSVTLHTNTQVGDVSNRTQCMILHQASANWGPLGFLIRPVQPILISSKS